MPVAQERRQEDDLLLQSSLQREAEQETTDSAAEDEAVRAAVQHATGEEIPAQTESADALTTQNPAGKAASASEQALGQESNPGLISSLFGSKKDQEQSQEGAPPESQAKSDESASAANGPWTAETIAKLVADKSAGGVMRGIAARDTKNAIALLKASGAWDKTLKALPEGDALAAASKQALYRMVEDQNVDISDAKKLFEIRFNHPLKDQTGSWTLANVAIVWNQLDHLPEQDVSDEKIFTAFYAIAGAGGFYTWTDIQLGEDITAEHMPHTVRHEVGHGVHDHINGEVEPWLQNDMSFSYVDTDNNSLDSWITGLGGYPEQYTGPDGKDYPFDATTKTWIWHMVRSFTGSSSWDPARNTPDESENDWYKAAWAAMPDAVRNACAQSTRYWYQNWRNFQTGTDGKRYFLNHWYNRAYTIGNVAAAAIEATGEDYTSMSEYEFFANCYAEYFGDPAGVEDASKWGGSLPKTVKDFFKTVVLERHPYSEFTKSQKKKNT